MIKTVLIAGGTGLIGARLTALLQQQGREVRLLTRRPQGPGQFAWNPAEGRIDTAALAGVDAIINLAGAGIADARWTPARKQLLIDSRVQSADVLHQAIQNTGHQPQVYVSASAIGIYGDTGAQILTEDTPIDTRSNRPFMVACCDLWEQAADRIAALGIRTVKLRIGIVLAREGGALAEIAKPVRFGLGAYFGDGKAWYSWIHRDDMCRMLLWAADQPQISGVYNAVAPQPVQNYDFVKTTARAMGRWALMAPAPAFALRIALGEMSAVVLNSNRVSAQKVVDAGFQFQFPELEGALKAVLR